jgi:hypothetical protein
MLAAAVSRKGGERPGRGEAPQIALVEFRAARQVFDAGKRPLATRDDNALRALLRQPLHHQSETRP